nr:hypothetical protein CFP56_19189 [Quercus suber]
MSSQSGNLYECIRRALDASADGVVNPMQHPVRQSLGYDLPHPSLTTLIVAETCSSMLRPAWPETHPAVAGVALRPRHCGNRDGRPLRDELGVPSAAEFFAPSAAELSAPSVSELRAPSAGELYLSR